MSKVLYVKSSPKPEDNSYYLKVGRQFINDYKKANPDDTIE